MALLATTFHTGGQDDLVSLILFGAFDRHNLGDLLFAHIAEALLPGQPLRFAGLLQRDMRPFGGHFVESVTNLATHMAGSPVRLLHVGGELLTCSAWEAAVMLLPASGADPQLAHGGDDARTRQRWAQATLGMSDLAPYTMERGRFPQIRALAYDAVGGVGLAPQAALYREVLHKLAQADIVTVRDRHTEAAVRAAGIQARMLPDPAVMVAELFAAPIMGHAQHGEIAQLRTACPNGYLAMQFSADFGAQAFLEQLADGVGRVVAAYRCGIVLFRAGAAPLHDDLEPYRRLAVLLKNVPVHIFHSLNIWDICALLAHSRGYCGSSLHGRIVALAFGKPRLTLRHPDQPRILPTKHEAFVQTWEDGTMPGVVAIEEVEQALLCALNVDPQRTRDKANELAALYRREFGAVRKRLMA
jgi:hypothetical protein